MSETKRVWHDDTTFIAAWQSAGSAQEVATNLNLKLASVQARSRHMRDNGVPLKEFPKHVTTKKDEAYWAEMARLARSALPEGSDEEE